jgi:predicted metal-dependent HD superfamily phosphohydrolase
VPGLIAVDPVRTSWINAVSRLNGNLGKAQSSADDLLARYGEPHRHYHALAHIKTVLTEATLLAEELDLDVADREVLVLAVCAHDVVYDGRPGDDERASAAWARTQLADAGVDEDVVARVGDLILATINHQADVEDGAADVLLDADLSILGASLEAYDAYTVAVRQEYSQVPDRLWRAGRTEVLSRLLDREHLYRTPGGRGRWEAAARANIQRELARLG